jgi:hypothetical protein
MLMLPRFIAACCRRNDVNPDDDVVSLMLPTAQPLPKPAFLVWTGVTFADE